MNTISRTIAGIALFVLGSFIVVAVLSEGTDIWSTGWGMVWGVLLVGLGVYIFFNKKEDDIEEITDSKK